MPVDILGNLLKQLLEEAGALSEEVQNSHTSHRQRDTKQSVKELIELIHDEASRFLPFSLFSMRLTNARMARTQQLGFC